MGRKRLNKRSYVKAYGSNPRNVDQHVAVAERALGKPLPVGAQVHHVDKNPHNNEPSNLVVCENAAYHRLLHVRTDALCAVRNASARRCQICKEWVLPADPDRSDVSLKREPGGRVRHRSCHARTERERRA